MRRRRLPKQPARGAWESSWGPAGHSAGHDGRGQARLAQVGSAGLRRFAVGFLEQAREGPSQGVVCLPVAVQGLTGVACRAGTRCYPWGRGCLGCLAAGMAPQGRARQGRLLVAARLGCKGGCTDAAPYGAASGHVHPCWLGVLINSRGGAAAAMHGARNDHITFVFCWLELRSRMAKALQRKGCPPCPWVKMPRHRTLWTDCTSVRACSFYM